MKNSYILTTFFLIALIVLIGGRTVLAQRNSPRPPYIHTDPYRTGHTTIMGESPLRPPIMGESPKPDRGGLSLVSARGQSQSSFDKGVQTLTEIENLLDRIIARLSKSSSTASIPINTSWMSLFDGKTMDGWQRTDFSGGGSVKLEKSFRGGQPAIVVNSGTALSGINWTRDTPSTNYEISLEALKIDGSDFACGLTFPVESSHASLILGGWGGTVVGISNIDNLDASENATTRTMSFPKDKWFVVRMRVTPAKLEAWVDEKKLVDQDITGRKISLRFGEISKSVPIGLANYQTSSAFRNIRIRRLAGN